MKPIWKKYLLYAGVVIVGGVLVFILIQTVRVKNTGFEVKTLWDWMELLIIPLVLASGAFYLNRSERALERRIAEDRAKLEREIATDRQQEAALQAYIDRMTDLLLRENLLTTENSEVRNVAKIRTLTLLRGLDATRKGFVLRFIDEAGLIRNNKIIVDLRGADLTNVNLSRAILGSGANLSNADLSNADLSNARLGKAILSGANLSNVDLSNADLLFTNLSSANLSGANLSNANMGGASLWGANLSSANLSGAELNDANLSGAIVTNELLASAGSLAGATMPDGTKHK